MEGSCCHKSGHHGYIHLPCTQTQLLGSKEMFANNCCFQPVVFLAQREALKIENRRSGITLNLKREWNLDGLCSIFFFLSLKCSCYLFKGAEWQAISLVYFPILCKLSCCLILPRDLLHNHHSQKKSQGHETLMICLWWNFNQQQWKSLQCDHADLISHRGLSKALLWKDRKMYLIVPPPYRLT